MNEQMDKRRWGEMNGREDVGMECCSNSAPGLLKIEFAPRCAISLMHIICDTGVLAGSVD